MPELSEGSIEQEIKNLGADRAPRVTPASVDQLIVGEEFWIVPGTTTIVCALKLHNEFVVIGKSACASRENFNPVIGRKIARDNAREKIWELEGYRLRCSLYEGW